MNRLGKFLNGRWIRLQGGGHIPKLLMGKKGYKGSENIDPYLYHTQLSRGQ